MSTGELRGLPLFEGLDDAQLRTLTEVAAEHRFAAGEELFTEGQPANVWWVLLEGSVSLVRHTGAEETTLGAMETPGQWAGGFRAWDEFGVYLATGRAATAGRVLRVEAKRLRSLADEWFPFGVHFIEGLVHTVRRIEDGARQREALVALGTLAAGLAHEINNPASAATRAVSAMPSTATMQAEALAGLARHSITPEQFVGLDTLRQDLAGSPAAADPLSLADQEDSLSDWLTEHDVERAWEVAPTLAAAGADVVWCERVSAVVDAAPLPHALAWVASTVTMAELISEVTESTRRVSDLVAAVRSYSQLDRATVQSTDLVEGLESTLVMLAHKVDDGVEVVRDFRAVPPFEARAGELNQVWTNLIDNALDAMGGLGTLRVSTRLDGDWAEVAIADTGPGMTEEVRRHAFEPFFTTKDVGRGTGLGLDISRRIVEDNHHGEIAIDSSSAGTVVVVRLPVRSVGTATTDR